MSIISQLNKWVGCYETTCEQSGDLFSPIIINDELTVTVAGFEVQYEYYPDIDKLQFKIQRIFCEAATITIKFKQQPDGNVFDGLISVTPLFDSHNIKGWQVGHPLSYWAGIYDVISKERMFSRLIVETSGEIHIDGEYIDFEYNPLNDKLTFNFQEIAGNKIKGEISFITPNKKEFKGFIQFETGEQIEYLGEFKGLTLSYWSNYYTINTTEYKDLFSPLIIHHNGTVDIAAQRITSSYNHETNELSFDWQKIKEKEVKGTVRFKRDGEKYLVQGNITVKPQTTPINISGHSGKLYTVDVVSNYNQQIDIFALENGTYNFLFSLNPNEKRQVSGYQEQHFLARSNSAICSGMYLYPGIKQWIIDREKTQQQPSINTNEPNSNRYILNITNHLHTYLELWWADYYGEFYFCSTIPAKTKIQINTFEKQHWILMHQGKIISNHYSCNNKKEWVVEASSQTSFGIDIEKNENLTALPIDAYNKIGKGDFTVMGTVQTNQGGTVISRKAQPAGEMNGGFMLVIQKDGSIKFLTDDGIGFYEVYSNPLPIFDNEAHSVAGVRKDGKLIILFDGKVVPVTPKTNRFTPLDINNNRNIMIGATEQAEIYNQFIGTVFNAGIWSRALKEKEIHLAMMERISSLNENLLGYWNFNYNLSDLSEYKNSLRANGSVAFVNSYNWVWTYGENQHVFCQIENPQNDLIDIQKISRNITLSVPKNAPYLYSSIFDNAQNFQIPNGVIIEIFDPTGKKMNQDIDTEKAYVKVINGSTVYLMLSNPMEGEWKVSISSNSNIPFFFQLQTIPSKDIVKTSINTLSPLYSDLVPSGSYIANGVPTFGLTGFWNIVSKIAVAALVGITVGLMAVALSVTLPVAVVAGLAAYALTTIIEAEIEIRKIENNKNNAFKQFNGIANFDIAKNTILLIDANTDGPTTFAYDYRKNNLYTLINAGKFSKRQISLIGADDNRNKVAENLKKPEVTYVTVSGHGLPQELLGFGNTPVLELGQYDVKEAQNKIFHFLSCNCAKINGIGRELVQNGAKAFFGYVDELFLFRDSDITFSSDLEVDKQLINGATAREAYVAALMKYEDMIVSLRRQHRVDECAIVEHNRNLFRGPGCFSPGFGDDNAKIED